MTNLRKKMLPTNQLPLELKNGRYRLEPTFLFKSDHGTWIYQASDMINGKKLIVKYVQVNNIAEVSNEIEMMNKFDHKHILKLYDLVELPELNVVALVQDYMLCGDLLDYLNRYGPFSEETCAKSIYHFAEAMREMHANSVVHRDIKPDNIFIKEVVNNIPNLIVGDLGFACVLEPDELLTDFKGTFFYLAPEILQRRPYSFPVDVWSFGVTLYICLVGQLPFDGQDNPVEYQANVINNTLDDSNPLFSQLSSEAQELIASCLDPDPNSRFTFEEICSDPWFDMFYPERNKGGDDDDDMSYLYNISPDIE